MPFAYDATGIDPDMSFPVLEGKKWYSYEIMETEAKKNKSGNNMVVCKVKCITKGFEGVGGTIYHYVSFPPKGEKGAGIGVHFLKAIGEPFEGELDIDEFAWLTKRFDGYTIVEEYEGKKRNKITQVEAYQHWDSDEVKEGETPF